MPIKPSALLFVCNNCGWKKCIHPRSDALCMGIDTVEQCERCASTALEIHRQAPEQPSALNYMRRWLRQHLV